MRAIFSAWSFAKCSFLPVWQGVYSRAFPEQLIWNFTEYGYDLVSEKSKEHFNALLIESLHLLGASFSLDR